MEHERPGSTDPSFHAIRKAVERVIGLEPVEESLRSAEESRPTQPPTVPVLVACSGGADSLALLAATVAVANRPVIGVTVDHGLQDNSAVLAEHVVAQMAGLGATETVSVRVHVEPDGRGIEAAAREARYAVLTEVAGRFQTDVVLLGHTFDDQAETVLLGLTRGSGGRSLAGMRHAFEAFHRPLLTITRAQTEAACRALGITWWIDPHNQDPRFTRSRLRHVVLPLLEQELGPGVAASLVRTADHVRRDVDALDDLAAHAMEAYDASRGFVVGELTSTPAAIRTRMLRLAAVIAGCPPGELFAVHIDALDAQVANTTHLPKSIQLPGHVTAIRTGTTLRFVHESKD